MRKKDFFSILGLGLILATKANPGYTQTQPQIDSNQQTTSPQSRPAFEQYLVHLQHAAQPHGFDDNWLADQFSGVKRFHIASPNTKATAVSAETSETLEHFLPKRFTDAQVAEAVTMLNQYDDLLQALHAEYGVQPRFLIALWGVVSGFKLTETSYPLLSVTSSQAYDDTEIQPEVIAALKLLKAYNLDAEELSGERDGKLAKSGFSPSMLLSYGRDGDGDGRVDHRQSVADVLASYAHFLSKHGWQGEQIWGRQVTLPKGYQGPSGIGHRDGFDAWQAAGVRRFNGQDLPKRGDMQPSLVQPDGPDGRAYLVYDNYRALLAWQTDHYFALSVSYLSERIRPEKQ